MLYLACGGQKWKYASKAWIEFLFTDQGKYGRRILIRYFNLGIIVFHIFIDFAEFV